MWNCQNVPYSKPAPDHRDTLRVETSYIFPVFLPQYMKGIIIFLYIPHYD